MATSMRDALSGRFAATSSTAEGSAAAAPAPSTGLTASAPAEASGDSGGESSQAEATGNQAAVPAAAAAAASASEPFDDDSDPHPVPRKALIEERKKRQEFEKLYHELNGKLQVYDQQIARNQPQPPPAPKVDPLNEYYENPPAFVDKRIEAAQRENHTRFLSACEAVVRQSHPDYDQKFEGFAAAIKAQPQLFGQMNRAANPALFAYEAGKAYLEAQKYGGSLDQMREAIRTEERAKIEAEIKKSQALNAADQATPTITGARGAGTGAAASFAGPTPMHLAVRQRA